MIKFFTTLLIVLGAYSITLAQTNGDVEFNANIGYNNAYVTEAASSYSSPGVSGFNVGAGADYYFSDRWSIKGKLIYDQKGWGNGFLANNNGTTLYGVDFKLNYLTVPIMANWHFGKTRNWYLHFGPYIGFLLSADQNRDNTDIKPAFNSTDGGLALGIGVKFPVTDKMKFFIECDGQAGFTDIFKQNSGSSVRSSRSSLNIGVTFPVSKVIL